MPAKPNGAHGDPCDMFYAVHAIVTICNCEGAHVRLKELDLETATGRRTGLAVHTKVQGQRRTLESARDAVITAFDQIIRQREMLKSLSK